MLLSTCLYVKKKVSVQFKKNLFYGLQSWSKAAFNAKTPQAFFAIIVKHVCDVQVNTIRLPSQSWLIGKHERAVKTANYTQP